MKGKVKGRKGKEREREGEERRRKEIKRREREGPSIITYQTCSTRVRTWTWTWTWRLCQQVLFSSPLHLQDR